MFHNQQLNRKERDAEEKRETGCTTREENEGLERRERPAEVKWSTKGN